MSQFLPPPGWTPPPGYQPPYVPYSRQPEPPRPPIGSEKPPVSRSRRGTLIAWLLILAAVAAVLTRDRWATELARRAMGDEQFQKAKEKKDSNDIDVAEVRSPQLLLASRYAIGVRSFIGETGSDAPKAPTTQPTVVQKLIPQLDAAAETPIDRFRLIPVIGELSGPTAALARLNEFERKYEVVKLRRDVDLLRKLYTSGAAALSQEERQYLVGRHGWFGRLATVYGASPDSPERQAVLAPARRTAGLLIVLSLGGLAALGVGVILLILAIVWLINGTIRPAYVPPTTWRSAPFAEAFALYLAGFIVISVVVGLLLGGMGASGRSIWPSAAVLVILPLIIVYLRLRGISWDEAAAGLGWHRGRGVFREIGSGLVGYMAGLPIIGLGILISMWLMRRTGEQAAHPIIYHPVDRPLEAWGVFILACVVAPIVEETMFRGALFHHLRARLGFLFSALVTSLIFAAIHPQGWAAVPVLASIALVLSAIRQWRGSLIGCITAHSLNNGIVTLILLAGMS